MLQPPWPKSCVIWTLLTESTETNPMVNQPLPTSTDHTGMVARQIIVSHTRNPCSYARCSDIGYCPKARPPLNYWCSNHFQLLISEHIKNRCRLTMFRYRVPYYPKAHHPLNYHHRITHLPKSTRRHCKPSWLEISYRKIMDTRESLAT